MERVGDSEGRGGEGKGKGRKGQEKEGIGLVTPIFFSTLCL